MKIEFNIPEDEAYSIKSFLRNRYKRPVANLDTLAKIAAREVAALEADKYLKELDEKGV